MPGIILNRAEDRPYGPGNPDYIYDQWRDEMDEKMSEAEREFEEWCKEEYPDSVDLAIRLIPARKAYLAAAARYTERTARRCVEICKAAVPRAHTYASENADIYHAVDTARDRCVEAIAKEFGLD